MAKQQKCRKLVSVLVRYIRDANGELWAVYASWYSGGLFVAAPSLGSPRGWGAGDRFISR